MGLLPIRPRHDALLHPLGSRPDSRSITLTRGCREGAHRPAQHLELGPPVGGAVLVLVAVVEGIEDGQQWLEGLVGVDAFRGRDRGLLWWLHGGMIEARAVSEQD